MPATSNSPLSAEPTPPVTASEVAKTVDEFVSHGWHRTGSDGDRATVEWLVERLAAVGLTTRKRPFEFPRVEIHRASVEADAVVVEGTPAFDTPPLPGGFVEAPLSVPSNAKPGDIVLFDASLAVNPQQRELWGADDPSAIVVVAGDPDGNIALRNAEALATPRGLPLLQLGPNDAAPLRTFAAERETVRLHLDHSRASGLAANVVGETETVPGRPWIVVMTPISGWFHCAAERGGGIAIALAVAERAVSSGFANIRFVFSSGHEFGHWGLSRLLEEEPTWRDDVALWVHLGASLGARHRGSLPVLARSTSWRTRLEALLDAHGVPRLDLAPEDRKPAGEAREVFDHPFVSLAGLHRYFHSPQDLPAVAVDEGAVADLANAITELVASEWNQLASSN